MLKKIIALALILLSSQKAFAEVQMHHIESESPSIAIFNPGSENLTQTALVGIRLNRRPVLSNSCGEINTSFSQYNIGNDLAVINSDNQGIDKLINTKQLSNQILKNAQGCATQDYRIVSKIGITGLQPNKPYVIEEKVLNYRKLRYNSCGFALLSVANVISYQHEGTLYFDVSGKKATTSEQLESFFSQPLVKPPLCTREQVYYPVGN